MEDITIQTPDTEDLAPPTDLVGNCGTVEITDTASHRAAVELARECRRRERLVDDALDPSIAHAYTTHKSLTTLRKETKAPYLLMRKAVEGKIAVWVQAERDRVAREKAAADALERKRVADEEAAFQKALEAENSGDTTKAEAMVTDIIESTPADIELTSPRVAAVAGHSASMLWSAEVFDLRALVLYVAEQGNTESLLPNMPHLNAIAKRDKQGMTIPGVRAVSKPSNRYTR